MAEALQHPEIESLDRDGILAIQRAKLAALGKRLAARPEWASRFARAGLKPEDLADPQALAAVPMLEKSDLRALYPFPMLGVPMESVVRFCATSGTTGLPVLFGSTARDFEELLPWQMTRSFRCGGLRPGDRVFQGHGYGLWIGGVSMDIGLRAYGAVNFPVGPGRGELAVQWLRDHGLTACIMSPLWLARLADIARGQGIDPRRDWKLRTGLLGGQGVVPEFFRQIEQQMPEGFRANNIYGTTESGGPNLGVTCPHSRDADEMHLINEDTVLTEIVDSRTLKPVPPGEVGEIVVSTLDKEGSPVVRWNTHDLVRLSNKPYDCACGRRGLPRVSYIIGRSDDMLKIRGVIVFPSQVEEVIAATAGIAKDAWQIYVDRSDRVLEQATVAIERTRDCSASAADLERNVAEALRGRLGVSLKVACSEPGTLPRYEGKAQRVLVRD